MADVEGQLSLRLQGAEFGGDVTTLSLTQPLNYLAPVLAVDRRGPLGREALLETIEDEYSFRAGREALAGAETLGFLASSRPSTLTDQGELAATVLRGYGIETLEGLRLAKEETRGSTVVEIHRPIAILLGNSFSRHPEFGLLLEALWKEGEVVYFPELLERLVREYPNVFLSAFCTTGGREQARELIERGESDRLYQDREVWAAVVRNNVLFNFVQQLKHVGVLAPETRSHSGAIDEYNPDEKPWIVSRSHVRGDAPDDT